MATHSDSVAHAGEIQPSKTWTPDSSPKAPWDHRVVLSADQVKGIGLRTALVQEQTLPTLLRLSGVTDYDPAKLTVVRPQFFSRVEAVLVDLGSLVQKDTPCWNSSARTWLSPRMITRRLSASMTATSKCSITRPRWPRLIPYLARS